MIGKGYVRRVKSKHFLSFSLLFRVLETVEVGQKKRGMGRTKFQQQPPCFSGSSWVKVSFDFSLVGVPPV